MTTDLQKVILITGCSTGIGMATAVCLATDPARIYKVYAAMRSLEKKEALEKAAKDCLGQTLHIRQLDVCSDEHADKVVDEIFAKEGRLDILGSISCQIYRDIEFSGVRDYISTLQQFQCK